MSWDELEPDTKTAAPKAPVRVQMVKMKSAARARMWVLVETDILTRLGGKALRYKVQVGKGPVGHQLRIQQDDAGRFEAGPCGPPKASGQPNRYQRIRLPVVDHLPDEPIKAVACEYAIEKATRSLIITLPAWAWHKRQAVAA